MNIFDDLELIFKDVLGQPYDIRPIVVSPKEWESVINPLTCETCGLPMAGPHTTAADCIQALKNEIIRLKDEKK